MDVATEDDSAPAARDLAEPQTNPQSHLKLLLLFCSHLIKLPQIFYELLG